MSQRVQFTVSKQVASDIEALLATGLWGLNRAAVARELLLTALRAEVVRWRVREVRR